MRTLTFPMRDEWWLCSAAFLLLAVGSASSCTLLLNENAIQCMTDLDCGRFSNAVCNRLTNLCIPRPGSSALAPDSAAASDGPDGGGEAANRDGANEPGRSDLFDNGRAEGGLPPSADGSSSEIRPIRECPDLDGNGVLDCKESLVVNPDFRVDIMGWTPELNIAQSFLPNDGDGNLASGCIAVTNASGSDTTGSTAGGSWQCVHVSGGTNYEFLAQALVPINQGAGTSAGAAFQFFATTSCTSPVSGQAPLFVDTSATGWVPLQGTVSSPVTALSVVVRLIVVKPFRQQPTQALFDNILFKAK